ncbi:MAG: hypothetical protein QOK37_4716 [Thermoanaerobaculia bacterium]|nr:hypothetical protein [Thermoanaerobaculia bacterium]
MYDGGDGMLGGICRAAVAMAACTSCAAVLMSSDSANCNVIDVLPSVDDDVIESRPATVENCFSSGVATAAAIVSGLAPGNDALTWIVGKSTFGRSLTGNVRYAMMPKTRNVSMTRVVMTGRRMKVSAMFMIAP